MSVSLSGIRHRQVVRAGEPPGGKTGPPDDTLTTTLRPADSTSPPSLLMKTI